MKPQLVVEGGARRVRISASEGVQHRAHRRGLGDFSPGSRVRAAAHESNRPTSHRHRPNSLGKIPVYSHQHRWEAARGPAVDRTHVHREIEVNAGPRPEPLVGLHLQPGDRRAPGLRQLQGRGGADHAVLWAG